MGEIIKDKCGHVVQQLVFSCVFSVVFCSSRRWVRWAETCRRK